MVWGQLAAGLGAGAAGALFGPDQENIGWGDIWGPNAGHALRLTDTAATLPNQRYFQGDAVADLTPAQQNAISQMINYGNQRGGNIANQMFNQGMTGLGTLNQGSGYIDMMAGRGAPEFQYDQGVFDQTMANLMPGLQSSYDAATRDIQRELDWNTLPGLNMDAAMTGNLASSALADNTTLAQMGAADRMADVGAGLWANAANQAQQAAMGAGQQTLGSQLRSDATFLSGASNLAGRGLPGYGDAYQTGMSNIDLMLAGGGMRQGQQQAEIDADMARHFWEQQQPYTDVAAKLAILSGSQLPPSTPVGPNTFGNFLNAGMFGLGLYDALDFGSQPAMRSPNLDYGWLDMDSGEFAGFLGN